MTTELSRRATLRAGLIGSAALAMLPVSSFHSPTLADDNPPSYNVLFGNPPLLGRVEAWWDALRSVLKDPANPDDVARLVGYHEVLPIYGVIHYPPPFPRLRHNDVWFDVGDGYIHSSYVVPVHESLNQPEDVPDGGFWGEISVPLSLLHWRPQRGNLGRYRLAYGTVYRVAERADDADGRAWYRLLDDGYPRAWWVEAQQVRHIQPEELTPISPAVSPDRKRIEVSVSQQRVTCYETDLPVFATRISTGTAYINPEGKQYGFNTPIGQHRVEYKRPTRHMSGGDPTSRTNHYDLPGIPWCTYFTLTGAAIHGTYWHNNYGRPASHGCINVPLDAAKWIYRWVNPSTAYDEPAHWTADKEQEAATVVIVNE